MTRLYDELSLEVTPLEPEPVLIEQLAALARASTPSGRRSPARRVGTPLIAAIVGSGLALGGAAYAERSHLGPLLDSVIPGHRHEAPPAPAQRPQEGPAESPSHSPSSGSDSHRDDSPHPDGGDSEGPSSEKATETPDAGSTDSPAPADSESPSPEPSGVPSVEPDGPEPTVPDAVSSDH